MSAGGTHHCLMAGWIQTQQQKLQSFTELGLVQPILNDLIDTYFF